MNIGSVVHRGQLIAELDDRETSSQVDQARANLAAARTRLGELEAGYSAQVVQSSTDVERAQANLTAACSRLEQARTTVGAVPLEVTAQIQQARAAVEQAEANRANAKSSYERVQHLFDQGFIAKQDVDNARTQHDVAAAQVRHAQAVLDAANANASQTQIKQQDVAQAEEGVRQADSRAAHGAGEHRPSAREGAGNTDGKSTGDAGRSGPALCRDPGFIHPDRLAH